MMPARPSRSAAFTLLEVLVSLAIFALAAVILGATYFNVMSGYQGAGTSNTHEQDRRFVRTAVLLGEPDRKRVEAGGELALPENRVARWQASVADTPVADLFCVTWRCEIRDPNRGLPWVGEEKFLLLRPTWSDPVIRDRRRQESRQRWEKERGTVR